MASFGYEKRPKRATTRSQMYKLNNVVRKYKQHRSTNMESYLEDCGFNAVQQGVRGGTWMDSQASGSAAYLNNWVLVPRPVTPPMDPSMDVPMDISTSEHNSEIISLMEVCAKPTSNIPKRSRWDKKLAFNYDDSYSHMLARGRRRPINKEVMPLEEPAAEINLFNLASMVNQPSTSIFLPESAPALSKDSAPIEIVDIRETSPTICGDVMEVTPTERRSSTAQSHGTPPPPVVQENIFTLAQCFTDFDASAVPVEEPKLVETKAEPIQYVTAIYCDLCHVKLTNEGADEHLQLYKHTSASLYDVPVKVEGNEAPEELVPGSRVSKAECFTNLIHVRDAEIICICLPCNRQHVVFASPLRMSAHCRSHRSRNERCEGLDHFAYCEARGDDVMYEVDLRKLKKCHDANFAMCLKCEKTFDTFNKAHSHMLDQDHTLMRNNRWRPVAYGRHAKDIAEITLAYCIECDMEFPRYNESMISLHLNAVHGANYDENSEKKYVNVIFRTYDLLKMGNCLEYSDDEHRVATEDAMEETYKEIKKAEIHKYKVHPEVGEETELLVEALPADPNCRTRSEYVCDICHRLLGRNSDDYRRHMSKYQHCSVSWCYTVSYPNQEPTVHSIIDASKVFSPRYMCKSVICVCSVENCERLSSEPYTIHLHQQMIHKMSYDRCSVHYYAVESVSDYVITVDNLKKPYVCEKCGQGFSEKEELLCHMTIQGHQILRTYDSNEMFEVARCLVCSDLELPISADDPKMIFRTDERLLSHLNTHVNKPYSRIERGITLELSFAIQRLERAGIPPQAYSSISSLSRMRERTLEVIVRSKKNVNRHEYGRAEKFLTKLRREREALDRKERETLRDEERRRSRDTSPL